MLAPATPGWISFPFGSNAQRVCDRRILCAPVIGMVAGSAAMGLANHERLKKRMDAVEKRLAQAEERGGVDRAG